MPKLYRVPGLVLLAMFLGVSAQAAQYHVLHSFDGSDGAFPLGRLVLDASGNAYGTAAGGGSSGNGAVFRMAPDGTVSVLYSFAGGRDDGEKPLGGLAVDRKTGALYGMTSAGGQSHLGVIFRISASGKETILHNFSGAKDGNSPVTALLRDRSGNLYGTTPMGGAHNGGTIFRLSRHGTFTVLHAFNSPSGYSPYSRLKKDKAGNLYGTTLLGGHQNAGVVFRLAPDQTYTVLHAFNPRNGDGKNPVGGLARDAAGNIYGTTQGSGGGIVYKLAPDGTETILHAFGARKDGYRSDADLRRSMSGTLFGTTVLGGKFDGGTIFCVGPGGTEKVVHSFGASANDGANPEAGLTHVPGGGSYGVTESGGTNNLGTIFWVDN